MNVEERAELKAKMLDYMSPEEPGEFERLRKHIMLPAMIVVVSVYAVTAVCYLLGEAVIWLWGAVFGR